jgi:hypothetical protein
VTEEKEDAERTPAEAPQPKRQPQKAKAHEPQRAAQPPAPAMPRWRVKADKAVNINGTYTCVRAGQIIDFMGFSERAITSLREQGVEMEEVA